MKLKNILFIEQVKENVKTSTSISEVSKNLYGYSGGGADRIIKKIIKDNDIDISHFNDKSLSRILKKRIRVIKICMCCKKEFEAIKSDSEERKYCSKSCSARTSNSKRDTTNIKLKLKETYKIKFSHLPKDENGKTLLKSKIRDQNKICPTCNNSFLGTKKQTYCCNKCGRNSPIVKEKLRIKQLESIKNGTHKGWSSRKGKPLSYPEKFFMNVLMNNLISFEREKNVGKYFIDFAILNKKIALEIDGKQHSYEDRKIKDQEKDNYLLSLGWKVYRIKWKNPTTENNSLYIKEEIYKLIQFINIQNEVEYNIDYSI